MEETKMIYEAKQMISKDSLRLTKKCSSIMFQYLHSQLNIVMIFIKEPIFAKTREHILTLSLLLIYDHSNSYIISLSRS